MNKNAEANKIEKRRFHNIFKAQHTLHICISVCECAFCIINLYNYIIIFRIIERIANVKSLR